MKFFGQLAKINSKNNINFLFQKSFAFNFHSVVFRNNTSLFYTKSSCLKYYHPARELMKKNSPEFFSDPNLVAEELVRIISMHDKIKDPAKVTVGATFEEMGLDSLDFVECMLEIENYLDYDFGASDWEQFLTIKDIAFFISRDYFGQKH